MILKDFQKRTLEAVQTYLERLSEWRETAKPILEQDPHYDWVQSAWRKTAPGRSYLPRRDPLGRPLPSFCLKIPTGGGKTLLAIKVIDLVNIHYRRRQTGLVLWIVPTTQIYNQTLGALKDRDHPYRQQLDLASAGHTLVLEKNSRFSPADVRENLCVLMLMLPSANRVTKETLRMFRDSGGFERFFPGDDDVAGQRQLLEDVPNLDTFDGGTGLWERQIKTSLGNTLRLLEPLIILDEGHKAYSTGAKATLEGFNPNLIVELSATPPKTANVLVEVSGRDLLAEEMIKLDLHIRNSASVDWKQTLLTAMRHRDHLEEEAKAHEAASGQYIRPICVIQVERTGRDQRRAGLIHADDVREYLIRAPGLRPEHVAVKTSQRDELKDVDEVGGLMSRDCPIRYIITKQALQEGWDCAFAYVLCLLTNPSSRSALTQLVGRILRQPAARKTHVRSLDESYVFCFQRRGKDLLKEVRKGFGLEGLHGLEGRIELGEDAPAHPSDLIRHEQREPFQQAASDLVLPAFMIEDRDEWRLVYYEADILSRVPWDEVDVSPLYDLALGRDERREIELRAGLDHEPLMGEPDATEHPATNEDEVDFYFAANHLLDVMPNPWRGHELARRVFTKLVEKHDKERVAANTVFILEEMRKQLQAERDRLAERVFGDLLDSGLMRFMVMTDDLTFHRLPATIETPPPTPHTRQANREDGVPYQHNLFDWTAEDDLNGLENKVATYLDRQERLFFWYRNRSRKDYYVQGWQRGRIYADFIVTLRPDEADSSDAFHQVYVLETKGLHLKQADDTNYKRSVFDLCSKYARKTDWAEFVPAMRNKVVRFKVVDQDEWEHQLNTVLHR
ncbi:MAG: DEAD/DEAH box helicase family protein [Gammaproteobacteria bacterium]|nr:DEAD/DEAH box helicase family protein [Gammaproteobacteria bacterium]